MIYALLLLCCCLAMAYLIERADRREWQDMAKYYARLAGSLGDETMRLRALLNDEGDWWKPEDWTPTSEDR